MKNTISAVVIIILFVLAGWWIYNSSSNKGQNTYTAPVSQSNPSPELFANSPLSQSAYLISIPTYDANTQQALSGFTVDKKTLTDGSMQITLNATNPEYKTQTYVVKPGQKLYFIEKFLGDDSNNEERNTKDDSAVLVDANGYIVNQ